MIKRKYRKWVWIIAVTLLISNWQGFKNLSGLNDWYYRYSNISGTFTVIEVPRQGIVYKEPPTKNFILDKAFLEGCKAPRIPQSDTIVYRLFAINPLKFWRWGEYIFDWRYRLPYTDWEAVKKRRGFGYLEISKGCMGF